jgi:hypothetical protein
MVKGRRDAGELVDQATGVVDHTLRVTGYGRRGPPPGVGRPRIIKLWEKEKKIIWGPKG